MSTTPTTPVPLPILPEGHSHINDQLQASLAALAHKHVTISYTIIGVLVFVLAIGGVGGYIALKMIDAQLARAEKQEQVYLADKKISDAAIADLNTQLKTSAAARAAAEQEIANLKQQVSAIQTQASQKEQEVLKPGKTASEVYADVKAAYGAAITTPIDIVPSADKTEQMLAFRLPDIQKMTATKIDDNAANQIVAVNGTVIDQQKTEIDGLKKDLATSQDALGKLQVTEAAEHKALDDYKKVAKKTKFKKFLSGFWHGTETAIVAVAAFELGHKL